MARVLTVDLLVQPAEDSFLRMAVAQVLLAWLQEVVQEILTFD